MGNVHRQLPRRSPWKTCFTTPRCPLSNDIMPSLCRGHRQYTSSPLWNMYESANEPKWLLEHSNKEIHPACKCFHGASRRGAEWGTLEPGLARNVNNLNVLQKKWLLIRTKLRLDKCAVLWAVCNAVCSAVLTACPHVVR